MTQINHSPKIIIVGAGLAGLTAAYRLKQAGFSSEIYEARDRPGGRVLSTKLGDYYEELGGKSLRDGGNGEHILALIAELGLTTEVYITNAHHHFVYENQIYTLTSIFQNKLPPKEKMLELCNQYRQTAQSLGEIYDKLWKNEKIIRGFMELWARNYEGIESHYLSPHYIYFYIDIMYTSLQAQKINNIYRTDSRSVKNGNTQLILTLEKQLTTPIKYQSVLRRVEKSTSQFYLHFDNQTKVSADYVILTLPCSTLCDVEIDDGILEQDQLTAIQSLEYGTNAKIIALAQTEKSRNEYVFTTASTIWLNQISPAMTLYYGGAMGRFLPEDATRILANELPNIQLIYPDLVIQPDIPIISMSWINEKFSKGSYSYIGRGQQQLLSATMIDHGETVKKVFRSADKLFFAGEHTELENFATMEGAVRSGERVARQVCHKSSFDFPF